MTGARPWTADTPYPGARPFRPTEHDRFFGRAGESAALADLWGLSQLTFAVGPAGVGKTSLLHAGVLPLVSGRRAEVLPPGRVSYGATFPWAALPAHNPYSIALLRSWSPGTSATRLAGLNISGFIARRAEQHSGPILGVIDQAEELPGDSGPRWGYRRQFLVELREALQQQPRLHLLLIVRDEGLELLSDVFGGGGHHRVQPLSAENAANAVTGPLAATGRSFASGAADVLVSDLQTSRVTAADGAERVTVSDFVEPTLLQIACVQLWKSLPPDLETITSRDVRQYGDVSTALSAYCARTVAAVADEHEVTAARLHRWLLKTFVTDDGRRADAYEGPVLTAGMPNAVPRTLEDHHLLHASQRSGSHWYELLSERLIEPLRDAATQPPPATAPDEYLKAAERALSLADLDAAERYAKLTLDAGAGNDLRLGAEASSLLGNIAYARGKPLDAAPQYQKAATLFEAVRDTTAVAYQLAAAGQTLIDQGQLGNARDRLRAAADRVPHDPLLQSGLAHVLWQLGDGRAAAAVLTDALSIDPGNRAALRARGEILADLGDARDALRDLDRVDGKGYSSVHAARGLALAQLGDHEAARREIQAALAGAPQIGLVLLYAARATEPVDREAAAELARRAMDAIDPALSAHHREMARQLHAASQERRR